MEPTISLSIYIYCAFFFRGIDKMPRKKIVVGKVIVAKAIGVFTLYIGRTRFVN